MTDRQTPERIWAWLTRAGKRYWTTHNCAKEAREFIRLDIHTAVVAERDQLKAAMKEIMRHCPDKATRLKACKALEASHG